MPVSLRGSTAVNAALYQAGWFAVVLGGAHGRPYLGAGLGLLTVVLHFALSDRRAADLRLVGVALAMGACVETVNALAGVYHAHHGLVPGTALAPWLLVLWVGFATTFNHSMRWLRRLRRWLPLIGAVAGPVAFWGGERLGAIALTRSPERLALLAAEWAAVVPGLVALSMRFEAAQGTVEDEKPDQVT